MTAVHAALKGRGDARHGSHSARLARRERFLSEDHQRILQRLLRLRVATASQLARLCPALVGRCPSAVHERLSRMAQYGLLRQGLVRPSRGAYSSVYYQVSHAGLAVLGRADEKHLLRRPPQHVLEYFIFRAEIYATARAAGWHVGSPVLTPASDQGRYLALYMRFAQHARERHYAALLAQRGVPESTLLSARQDAERVERFAPRELTFELLAKVSASVEPIELALLVLDDPRRSVRAQVARLPCELHPGMRILLRDYRTRYDTLGRSTYQESMRLHQWRLALTKRYSTEPASGAALLEREATDPLFPDLWAIRTAAPNLNSRKEIE